MQLELLDLNTSSGKTSPELSQPSCQETTGKTQQDLPLCCMSYESWSELVTSVRGGYSQRARSACPKKGKGFSFSVKGKTHNLYLWPTPRVSLHKEQTMRTNAGRVLKTGYKSNLGEAICSVEHSPLARVILSHMESDPEYVNVDWVEQLMGLEAGWTLFRPSE